MAQSIKRNFAYQLLYRVVTLLTPLITAPYISRVLGPAGIGEYSYTYAVAQYFYIFAMLGISDYGNRSIARVNGNPQETNKIFSEIFTLQLFLAIGSILMYAIYIYWFSEQKILAILQGLLVISVLFDVTWFFFGKEMFGSVTVRNIVLKVSTVVCTVLFVKSRSDVWIYTLIMAGSTIIAQAVMWPKLIKEITYERPSYTNVLRHLRPNIILFFPVIAANLLNYVDKIMIGNICSNVELGLYDNAEKLIQIPNSLVTALGTVMLPRMSNLVGKGNVKVIQETISKSIVFVLFATSAFAFGISAVAKEFVPIFFGTGFEAASTLIYILSPAMVFISLANVYKTQYLLPNCKDIQFVGCLFVGVSANIVLNYILIPIFRAEGASYATLIAEAMIFLTEAFLIRKEVRILSTLKEGIAFVVIGLLMFLCVYKIAVDSVLLTLIIKIIMGAVVYLLLSVSYAYFYKRDYLKFIWEKA